MKKFIIISIISNITFVGSVLAQTANDVMLFSRHYAGGTARSMGMSGAFGALGGDPSVMSTNPAGLAVYRGSEFTITPNLNFNNTSAKFGNDNQTFNDNSVRFNFDNVGYVYTQNMHNQKGIRSFSIGFGYNRLGNFNSDAYVKRQTANSSMLDEFVYYANRDEFDPFYEELAWETAAIFKDGNEYINDYIEEGRYGQYLSRSMSTRGSIGEYCFSLGANIDNKLYFGATLGMQDIKFKQNYLHEEKPEGFDYLNYFKFNDEYTVDGWGFNFKAGLIYRPIPILRVGAAIHTPSYLWMKPEHFTSMVTRWNITPIENGGTYYDSDHYEYYETHTITTPWRYSFSAATVIGSIGIIDVDVEIVDYSTCKIAPRKHYDDLNDEVSSVLKTALNLKAGAEVRLGPLYLRGGVAYYGNPYNKDEIFDPIVKETLNHTMSYSAGIGFRNRDFYMDAAYSFMKHPESIYDLYMWDNGTKIEYARLQSNYNKVLITFGFRF